MLSVAAQLQDGDRPWDRPKFSTLCSEQNKIWGAARPGSKNGPKPHAALKLKPNSAMYRGPSLLPACSLHCLAFYPLWYYPSCFLNMPRAPGYLNTTGHLAFSSQRCKGWQRLRPTHHWHNPLVVDLDFDERVLHPHLSEIVMINPNPLTLNP